MVNAAACEITPEREGAETKAGVAAAAVQDALLLGEAEATLADR